MKRLIILFVCVVYPISLLALDTAFEQVIIDPTPRVEMHQPLRTHSIIVTESGYYPNKISVFEGEHVQFFVTTTLDREECFMVQSHQVFASAEKGKVTEVKAVFEKPGKYKMYCPNNKFTGTVTVLKNPTLEGSRRIRGRGIASISEESNKPLKPSHWMPREY